METTEEEAAVLPVRHLGKDFRLSAKKFLLTYSQVAMELHPSKVISQLGLVVPIDKYVIATEFHEDLGKHFHAVVISSKKLDVRDLEMFNVQFEGGTYKSHVRGVKHLTSAINYVKKRGSILTNMEPGAGVDATASIPQVLKEMAEKMGIPEAMRYYYKHHPGQALSGKNAIAMERGLKRVFELERSSLDEIEKSMSTRFMLEHFKRLPRIDKWVENGYQSTLILVAPGGCGKTQYVKTMALTYG